MSVSTNPNGARRSDPEAQLDVIREMLASMKELTSAGQQYTMTKIVAFVAERLRCGGLVASQRNKTVLAQLLDHLTREPKRVGPDAGDFNHRAGVLVDLLDAIAPRMPRPDNSWRSSGFARRHG